MQPCDGVANQHAVKRVTSLKSVLFLITLATIAASVALFGVGCTTGSGSSGAVPTALIPYRVRLVTNFPATCSVIFEAAGFTVAHRCGKADCYRQIQTGANIGTVQSAYDTEIVLKGYDMTAEVAQGTCTSLNDKH